MIFSSFQYVAFLLLFIGIIGLVKPLGVKKALLLIGSYYFYAYWDPRCVFLLFIMSAVNYGIGLQISKTVDEATRKRLLIFSVVFNLGVLGFFKYFNFFLESGAAIFGQTGSAPTLNIILPIGISFITFEVMSYTIDIYRRTGAPAKNFWDLALLVAFFPHLIAGPILKPHHFLPQIEKPFTVRWDWVQRGIQLFLLGLVKKLLVADRMSSFVDPVFNAPQNYSSATVILAVVAYALQIFCDFSGYTDMAIGSAYCLGLETPPNFNMPYAACNITDFWRRWHISLSSWLREYLYFSLGGNQKGNASTYFNLMMVMLLGGLWHGASWNFVIWGGMHGLWLALHKIYHEAFGKSLKDNPLTRVLGWALTMFFVGIAWVFFRSTHISTTMVILKKMLWIGDTGGTIWYQSSLLIAFPIVLLMHFLGAKYGATFRLRLSTFGGLFLLFFTLLGLLFLAPDNSSPFIYFQF
jgi:alginate O-acetyltransferase complex protein AlgI